MIPRVPKRMTIAALASLTVLLGSGCFSTEPTTGLEEDCEETLVVEMTDADRFAPACIRIRAGETVVWINESSRGHTVTADPDLAANPRNVALPAGAVPFHSGSVPQGGEFEYTFAQPGRYDYVCLPHEAAGMLGTVIVEE